MQRSGRRTEGTGTRQSARGGATAQRETSSSGAAVPPPLTAAALRAAQRGAGNAAVTGMIARRARTTPAAEQPDTGVHEVLRSAGKPLAAPLRREMESRLGSDFSDVRLHTGAAAARSARAIGARAYTSGSHVVIGDGGGDKHTLAHELTHVVQQRQGPVSGTDHGDGLRVSDPSDRFEREAEAMARRVMSGPAPASSGSVAEHAQDAEHADHVQRDTRATGTGTAAVQRAPGPGIKLLRDRDPAPHDTSPLRDWTTLRSSAQQPTAVDVHQILLTYQKLSNGWSSGMGEVQQALSNKFGEDNGVPETVVRFGPVLMAGGVPRGTSMVAHPLTLRGAAGSDATTGTYAGLGGAVEGHLLNAHLHGPATPENLAPFRKQLNAKHSRVVEEPLKKMIYNDRGTFHYEVVVHGDATHPLPQGITCHVVELNDDGTKMDDGYEQKVEIDQAGRVSFLINNTGSGPGPDEELDFDRAQEHDSDSELAVLWNQLRFPWTREYGDVVREVLETAHQAVSAYETQHRGFTSLGHLPRTVVAFTSGTFFDIDEDGNKVAVDMGTSMVADPLTLRPPSGQAGFEPEGGAWGLGAIRGHLLNHHLHGPAEPHNLAPMSSRLNQQFERDVESHVKRMVLEEGRVLRFEVRMSGSGDQFGFEDVPTRLDYVVQEYHQDPVTGQWQLAPTPLHRGRLSNESDENYDG
ncbi:DUF4157 domain-containing protein [Streptomyces sp. S.PNR 29]|uniref:eCIS core domain-containing protein n=1 Tax=Streptomyces sp. S.PNR 29 TaxID=2973805 RepID=UPI0025AF8BBD|nr:DUF4157 domain-containing protein [Streptomyces sp. S.PNR 29]MDN0200545.1 DUF4157 domain-containing protein [Streptomyces sp. S.PNR 29]